MQAFDWKTFLTGLSRELLAVEEIRDQMPDEVVKSEWLGFLGASEKEIEEVEARLGIRFPLSYRSFLKISNGWRDLGCSIYKLWPTDKVAWFRERNQGWIDVYVKGSQGQFPVSDEDYFTYGRNQDCVHFRSEYLTSALEISDEGDSAILLLNPKIVTPEGEWEAWFFCNKLPGAQRYCSFQEMMEHERRAVQSLLDRRAREAAGELPPHEQPNLPL